MQEYAFYTYPRKQQKLVIINQSSFNNKRWSLFYFIYFSMQQRNNHAVPKSRINITFLIRKANY